MKPLRLWLAALLLALGALPAAAQSPAPVVSLLTFGPGEVYWQRFGHNALLVQDTNGARVYNYGMFDFAQKNFFLNFARGLMLYRLDVQTLVGTLRNYQYEGRWVYQQQLNLDPAQARELADFLAWNAQPGNAEYRYDYFVANCSTRVRDAIDAVLQGALRRHAEPLATQATYRHDATRLLAPIPPLAAAMDFVMGPAGDTPLNRWQQSFVPMVLMEVVRGVTVEDAAGERPLVLREGWVLQSDLFPEPSAPLRLWPALAATGLLLGLLIAVLNALRVRPAARMAAAALSATTALLLGVAGLVLAASWALTEHWAMWRNVNLLAYSPLALLLLPALIARTGAAPRRGPYRLALLNLALSAVALLLSFSGLQQNLAWAALALPLHAAIAWQLRPR